MNNRISGGQKDKKGQKLGGEWNGHPRLLAAIWHRKVECSIQKDNNSRKEQRKMAKRTRTLGSVRVRDQSRVEEHRTAQYKIPKQEETRRDSH